MTIDWYSLKVLFWHLSTSMDGKGVWCDNSMIEMLGQSLKYECVYLNAYVIASKMRAGIGTWLADNSSQRPYSIQGKLMPHEAN